MVPRGWGLVSSGYRKLGVGSNTRGAMEPTWTSGWCPGGGVRKVADIGN